MKCTFKLLGLFVMLLLWVQMLSYEIENQNQNDITRSKKSWKKRSKKYKKKYKKIKNLRLAQKEKYQEMKMQLKGKF